MTRIALQTLRCRREETLIIGDRMDTDVIVGIEAQIDTILVLSGVASEGGPAAVRIPTTLPPPIDRRGRR
ncbi:MAG: hypothetical protein A2Y77_06040 [Planctomycetes bacterium RBG_13_62_9]|nr:MAG: hypothetical protein A2Y77_06040 [Planctomycetes bacterium RBG_13_62_9]